MLPRMLPLGVWAAEGLPRRAWSGPGPKPCVPDGRGSKLWHGVASSSLTMPCHDGPTRDVTTHVAAHVGQLRVALAEMREHNAPA